MRKAIRKKIPVPDTNSARSPELQRQIALCSTLSRCQDQSARFTMLPADYKTYDEIMLDFFEREEIQYEEFRNRMVSLLQNPSYEHLRFYFDVLHRAFTGEEAKDGDDILLYTPAVCFMFLFSCIISAQLRGIRWEYPKEMSIEEVRDLQDQWAYEWFRLEDRPYCPDYHRSRIRRRTLLDPDFDPSKFFNHFNNWYNSHKRRLEISPQESLPFFEVLVEFVHGRKTYVDFLLGIRALLER